MARVIITGGAGDIGLGMGKRLVADGFDVTLVDIKDHKTGQAKADSVGAEQGKVLYRQADICILEQIEPVLEEFSADTDVVIANAAVVKSSPFLEITQQQWLDHVSINLTGTFFTLQSAAKIFSKNERHGQIIITSSWVGSVPWPEIAAYSATKAGVEMLAKSASRELAHLGIRVNVIAPGIVNAGLAKLQLETEPQYAQRVGKVIPLGKLQTVEQVAAIASFLCSEGGDYFTGSTLLADGGCSLFQFD